MPAGYSFRPRAWTVALGAAACAAGIMLGNWQARRADEKRAAAAQREEITAQGEFLPQHTVLLDNRQRRGRVGYEVVTPLKGGMSVVLVNRGWIEAPRTRDVLPQVRTPGGKVRVQGVKLDRLPRSLRLPESAKRRVRQNLDIGSFAAESGLALEPYLIEQHSPLDDGLLREWPRPDAGVEKHQAYALQWYSLAALAVVLAAALSFGKT